MRSQFDGYDSGSMLEFEGMKSIVLKRGTDYKHADVRYSADYINIYDIDHDDELVGWATIARINSGFRDMPHGLPYIGMTETVKEMRRQGLGTRRLILANELSLKTFGLPLNSDLTVDGTEEEAASLWQKLVLEGKAEEVTDSDYGPTWRFKA